MKGMRPLTEEEVAEILSSFDGKFRNRDRALFILGIKSGFRISEMLSLKKDDVMLNGGILDRVYVKRANMKKKIEGRSVVLHPDAKEALNTWINEAGLKANDYVFQSRKGKNKPITRVQFWQILNAIAEKLGIERIGTHSMRKTFANKVYDNLGHDLIKTQRALGHQNINSTVSYLSFREEEIDEAILNC
jgi:integrase